MTSSSLRDRVQSFLAPFYQDLDGASRIGEVRRLGRIADSIAPPDIDRHLLDLLVSFQPLGSWLEKVGNMSRTVLALGGHVTELDLRRTAQSIKRLDEPLTAVEAIVAAARIIDGAGLRGVAERIARSRREGATIAEIALAGCAPSAREEWMPPAATPLLESLDAVRIPFCRQLLDELRGAEESQ